MRCLRALALALTLASCSGGGDPPPTGAPPVASGSRLEAVWSTGDGAEVPGNWYDRQLDERCQLLDLPGDRVACLPVDRHVAIRPYHSDATCTARLDVILEPACAPPAYVELQEPGTCPATRRNHQPCSARAGWRSCWR